MGIIDRSTAFANGTSRFTITTDATSHYLFIYDTSDTRNLNVPNMFVCEQQYADTYIPHAEKTYNFPLSEGQFLMEDGTIDGKVKNTKAQVVLDGTEGWEKTNNAFQTAGIEFPSDVALRTENTKAFSNMYKYAYYATSLTTNIQNNEFSWNSYKAFTIRDDNYSTATDFANHLAQLYANGTPVILEYELATPDETPFTTEQKAIIDEIINDGTYKEVTYYTAEASLNPDMEIGYYKDLETLFNNLQNS